MRQVWAPRPFSTQRKRVKTPNCNNTLQCSPLDLEVSFAAYQQWRHRIRGCFHSFHLSARSFQKRFRETFGYLRTFGFVTPFKVSGRKISVQLGFIMISFCVKTRLNGWSGIIKILVYLTFKVVSVISRSLRSQESQPNERYGNEKPRFICEKFPPPEGRAFFFNRSINTYRFQRLDGQWTVIDCLFSE